MLVVAPEDTVSGTKRPRYGDDDSPFGLRIWQDVEQPLRDAHNLKRSISNHPVISLDSNIDRERLPGGKS